MGARNGTTLVLFPTYAPTLTLVSCCFSVLGAAAIISTYICWKESRSTSRAILLCIAVSDLISALGYIFGAGLFLGTFHNATSVDAETAKTMWPFTDMCEVQSFVTTTAMMSSFWWTTILSLHLFLSVAKMRLELSRRLFPLYVCLSIAVPLAITVPSAATGWLGMGNSSASVSWCFITLKVNDTSHLSLYDPAYDILEFMAGKMWELLAFVFIFSFYVALKCAMSKRVSWQTRTLTTHTRSKHHSHYTDPYTHKLPNQGLFFFPFSSPLSSPSPSPSIHLSPPLAPAEEPGTQPPTARDVTEQLPACGREQASSGPLSFHTESTVWHASLRSLSGDCLHSQLQPLSQQCPLQSSTGRTACE